MPKSASKSRIQKKTNALSKKPAVGHPPSPQSVLPPPRPLVSHSTDSEAPKVDVFLEQAKSEPKRQLISDHVETINVLRDEKRFTFRAIAEWLNERGIEADHSAVYRAYLAAIPKDQWDPREPRDEEIDIPE